MKDDYYRCTELPIEPKNPDESLGTGGQYCRHCGVLNRNELLDDPMETTKTVLSFKTWKRKQSQV